MRTKFFSLLLVLGLCLPVVAMSQVCGNGALEGAEECDDDNLTAGDGCDAGCNEEPAYLCGCANPTAVFGASVNGGMIGGLGGGVSAPIGCAGNEALIGLGFQMSNGQACAVRTKVICGTLSVNNQGIVSTAQSNSTVSGGSGCFGYDPSTATPDILCPNGHVITGMSGKGLVGTLFSDVSIICSRLLADGSVNVSDEQTIFVTGSNGAGFTDQDAKCPQGTVAQSFQTRAGCGQDALSITCAPASFNCAGQTSVCVEALVCGDGVVQGAEVCDDGNTTPGDGCNYNCVLEQGYSCVSGPLEGPCTSSGQGSVSADPVELGCIGTAQFSAQVRIDGSAARLLKLVTNASTRLLAGGSKRIDACGLTRGVIANMAEVANQAYLDLWANTWLELEPTAYDCSRGEPPACTTQDITVTLDEMNEQLNKIFKRARRLQCGQRATTRAAKIRQAKRLRREVIEQIQAIPNPFTACNSN